MVEEKPGELHTVNAADRHQDQKQEPGVEVEDSPETKPGEQTQLLPGKK